MERQRHGSTFFLHDHFGLVASLLAVPTGVVDWSGINKEKPAWKIGLYHMILNLVVALLFAINLGLGVHTLRVEIDGQVIAIAKLDGNFYAFQEFCTHRFGLLSGGDFDGFNVQCPWHNSCFDVRTGKVNKGPAKVDLKTFTIETRDGKTGIVLPRERKES